MRRAGGPTCTFVAEAARSGRPRAAASIRADLLLFRTATRMAFEGTPASRCEVTCSRRRRFTAFPTYSAAPSASRNTRPGTLERSGGSRAPTCCQTPPIRSQRLRDSWRAPAPGEAPRMPGRPPPDAGSPPAPHRGHSRGQPISQQHHIREVRAPGPGAQKVANPMGLC